mgnify:FL=1
MVKNDEPAIASSPFLSGRVLKIAGGIYDVDTSDGLRRASLRGRVKQTDSRIVSVGDLVELESTSDEPRIAKLLPRKSALTRHGVAKRREQVIVANVDQVMVVAADRSPNPDIFMIDRLFALATLSEIESCLVVNKIDLSDTFSHEIEVYEKVGFNIFRTSAHSGDGLEDLSKRLEGRITVLTGQSGVGKSSLLNVLIPGLDLRVGKISERKGRGRHTTVSSALYPYPQGGYVADTPGLQYVALWNIDPSDVVDGFSEIAIIGQDCRFADCRHRSEPDCAVCQNVENGNIETHRYKSYLALLSESENQ